MLRVNEDDLELLPSLPKCGDHRHAHARLLLAFLGRQKMVAECKSFAAAMGVQILILLLRSWVIVLFDSVGLSFPLHIWGTMGGPGYRRQ